MRKATLILLATTLLVFYSNIISSSLVFKIYFIPVEVSSRVLFRCVLASLYEVVSVGWSDGPSDGNPFFFFKRRNEQFSL